MITQLFPMLGVLIAVLLGGWLVFRARSFSMPQPFFPAKKEKKTGKSHSYVSDLYTEPLDDLLDEDLSPAAARLRDQKLSDKEKVMRVVQGKK